MANPGRSEMFGRIVVAGSLDELRADRAILRGRCVQRGSNSPQVATTALASSEWYLARTRSACGRGRFGYSILDGQEAMPCP